MKVKWGGQELEQRLNDYEPRSDYRPYDGPRPVRGMYQWNITRVVSGESTNGFRQLTVFLTLDGNARPHTRKYDGFRMTDRIIVTDDGSTDFRVVPFLEAIGATIREFLNGTEVDPSTLAQDRNGKDQYDVTSIGKVRFNKPIPVSGFIKPQKSNPDYFDIQFYPPKDYDGSADSGDDADSGEDTDNDSTDDQPPARSANRRGAAARGRASGGSRNASGSNRETPF